MTHDMVVEGQGGGGAALHNSALTTLGFWGLGMLKYAGVTCALLQT